jgi:hypothetical protein
MNQKIAAIQLHMNGLIMNESHPICNLRIRDVLIRIRLLIRILLFSSVAFKMPTQNKLFCLLLTVKYIFFGFEG